MRRPTAQHRDVAGASGGESDAAWAQSGTSARSQVPAHDDDMSETLQRMLLELLLHLVSVLPCPNPNQPPLTERLDPYPQELAKHHKRRVTPYPLGLTSSGSSDNVDDARVLLCGRRAGEPQQQSVLSATYLGRCGVVVTIQGKGCAAERLASRLPYHGQGILAQPSCDDTSLLVSCLASAVSVSSNCEPGGRAWQDLAREAERADIITQHNKMCNHGARPPSPSPTTPS
ncbi:hypothetical protein S40293_10919 [Stachybotrys chartarum IBT 40293]|nr:hypothetical protein S40293_10919 [Stachybotrys chartarum IBT 40293]KFA72806.1 hypothetical protein S40288_11134 [Stachybotrys chartarum IBT 40288]